MRFSITITGTRPVLLHNGRLANPTDPWTQQLKALTSKRKKTDEDLIDIMRVEARAGAYETDANTLGLPTENVWRSIYDAATAFKLGKDIQRALSAPDVIEPLLVDGDEVDVDEFLKTPQNIYYKSVKNQRNRVQRSRPIVRNWSTTHTFDLMEDVIDPRELKPVFERAGQLVGVGDWRPKFGTYDSAVTE